MTARTKTLALLAAAVVLPGVAFVLLGEGFEASLSAWAASLRGPRLAAAVAGLLAADLLLPVPSSVVLAYAGRELGFAAAALAGAAGLTVSCEVGYWSARLLGRAAGADAELLGGRVRRAAGWWVVLTRPLPILAEAATLAAGLARVPHGRFLAAAVVGNVWVAACFAGLGAAGRDWPAWAVLAASATLPLAATGAARRRLRGRPGAALDSRQPERPMPLDKKQKKKLDVAKKKLQALRQQLAGARKQNDDADQVRQLDDEVRRVEREIEEIRDHGDD